jgi:hypothetical protein
MAPLTINQQKSIRWQQFLKYTATSKFMVKGSSSFWRTTIASIKWTIVKITIFYTKILLN